MHIVEHDGGEEPVGVLADAAHALAMRAPRAPHVRRHTAAHAPLRVPVVAVLPFELSLGEYG